MVIDRQLRRRVFLQIVDDRLNNRLILYIAWRFGMLFCSRYGSFLSGILGLGIGAVRVIAAAGILIERGGLRWTAGWRVLVLGGEMCGWLAFQIVDDRLNDGFVLLVPFFGILLAHGGSPFCLDSRQRGWS